MLGIGLDVVDEVGQKVRGLFPDEIVHHLVEQGYLVLPLDALRIEVLEQREVVLKLAVHHIDDAGEVRGAVGAALYLLDELVYQKRESPEVLGAVSHRP